MSHKKVFFILLLAMLFSALSLLGGVSYASDIVNLGNGNTLGAGMTVGNGATIMVGVGNSFDVKHGAGLYEGQHKADESIVLGIESFIGGQCSMAIGHNASTLGHYSIALGNHITAVGMHSLAIGRDSTISGGNYSTAIGQGTVTSGDYDIALGHHAQTGQGVGNIAIGENAIVSHSATNGGGWQLARQHEHMVLTQ